MLAQRDLSSFLIIIPLFVVPLKADTLTLSLDNFSLAALPGSSVTFSGLLENNGGSEVFLNGAGADLPYSELTFDSTPFFTLTPLSLSDGESYDGDLFSIVISDVALPGDYFGTFTVQGGVDSGTFDTVASADFQVTVAAASAAPEPSSGILVGLASVILLVYFSSSKLRVPGGYARVKVR